MYVNAHEVETPFKTLVGNAAWTLIHTAPYQVQACDTPAEVPAAAQAYASMVRAVMAAFPCKECRLHAAGDARVQAVVQAVESYAATVTAGDQPARVADALAVLAFELHNIVNEHRDPAVDTYGLVGEAKESHTALAAMEQATLAGFMRRMRAGRVPQAYVAQLLRLRWAPA